MKKASLPIILLMVAVLVWPVAAQGPDMGAADLPGGGWQFGAQVQNAGTASAQVVMTAYAQNGTSYDCGSQTVAVGASYTYLPGDCSTMPEGFIGSAVVSADQPILAVVNENNKLVSGGEAAGQYQGIGGTDAATELRFPLVKSDHNGKTTTFFIQNAGSTSTNIHAEFIILGASYTHDYNNVAANTMIVVNPSDASGMPSGPGTVGSLTVTSSGGVPLAGVVNEHATSAAVAVSLQATRGFTPGDYDGTVYCPIFKKRYGAKQGITGIQVQNVTGGGTSISVQVTYAVIAGSQAGQNITESATIADGASATFYDPSILSDGSLASVTVESLTSGGQVVAIVNEKSLSTIPQRQTTYSCIAAGNATTKILAPLVKENFNGKTTGVQVQNVGSSPATVTLVYKTDLGATVQFTHSDAIAVGSAKTFYWIANGGTTNLTPISGSLSTLNGRNNGVTITSSQNIVAIVNESVAPGSAKSQDNSNYEGFNVTP
jgi:hypothetical protein